MKHVKNIQKHVKKKNLSQSEIRFYLILSNLDLNEFIDYVKNGT